MVLKNHREQQQNKSPYDSSHQLQGRVQLVASLQLLRCSGDNILIHVGHMGFSVRSSRGSALGTQSEDAGCNCVWHAKLDLGGHKCQGRFDLRPTSIESKTPTQHCPLPLAKHFLPFQRILPSARLSLSVVLTAAAAPQEKPGKRLSSSDATTDRMKKATLAVAHLPGPLIKFHLGFMTGSTCFLQNDLHKEKPGRKAHHTAGMAIKCQIRSDKKRLCPSPNCVSSPVLKSGSQLKCLTWPRPAVCSDEASRTGSFFRELVHQTENSQLPPGGPTKTKHGICF